MSAQVKMIGRDVEKDIKDLTCGAHISTNNVANICELSDCLKPYSLQADGLRQLVGIFLGQRLAKSQQTSNWGNGVLTSAQITYAALDAVAGLAVYREQQKYGMIEPS